MVIEKIPDGHDYDEKEITADKKGEIQRVINENET